MLLRLIVKQFIAICLATCLSVGWVNSFALDSTSAPRVETVDRLYLVDQQINLLKERNRQSQQELLELQKKSDQGQFIAAKDVTKSVIDKAALDISVAKSNLDSINIELSDNQQTMGWLQKSIQEIDNQLNVLTVFGNKVAHTDIANPVEMRDDLQYQQKLLELEKRRYKHLQELHVTVSGILNFKRDEQSRLNTIFQSKKILMAKQEQVKDELVHQEEQNAWLQKLNTYYAALSKLNPITERAAYAELERNIYYANEKANYAYIQSLMARYADQIQQMKLVILRGNSVSLLNEIRDQVQVLNKQVDKLDAVLKLRVSVLNKHVAYLSVRKKNAVEFQSYIKDLSDVDIQYGSLEKDLLRLDQDLSDFKVTLDESLQAELSERQGLPIFGVKTLFELGKEILLVPALTFELLKSLSVSVVKGAVSTGALGWSVFFVVQAVSCFLFFFIRTLVLRLVHQPSSWRDRVNSKWLSLQWLRRMSLDLFIIGQVGFMMHFFNVPFQQYRFIFYLFMVFFVIKSIMVFARVCLVETTHDNSGHDVRLYRRLEWIVVAGGAIVALTVFMHQLPLIYELKSLFDRIFLLLMMLVSLLLLRSWEVIPQLIVSHMHGSHPYTLKCIRLIGLLLPLLMLGNAIIGVFGYVNLIMSVSWYEGLFMVVLVAYLIIRGLLSDGMEQLSRLMIQYVHNGWLWTEAFLKPLDNILRVVLFFSAWTVLFLLYGWDAQSPVVTMLMTLLHYKLIGVLDTTITPLRILELFVVISVFYWTAKWTREFVYRLLLTRTNDMGIRNTLAILSQYSVVILGLFICLRVLGINLQALTFVFSMFAFGVGLGLRDLANNFACGFLILLERPLRVGDIVNISGMEGEVTNIGSRAITVRTWDYMELVVPNAEIFNKSFTNWTARDNIVRTVIHVKISRYDNPHDVKVIIQNVLSKHKDVLNEPNYDVYLKDISDTLMDFEIRYFVNIRHVKSRTSVASNVLMSIWDAFALHGIKPPYPQQEIVVRRGMPAHAMMPVTPVTQLAPAGARIE